MPDPRTQPPRLCRSTTRKASGAARRKSLEITQRRQEKAKERKRYAWAKSFRFLTVDGEATSDGRYVLLGCSDGTAIEDPEGLKTRACLDFLTSRLHGTLWGFAFDYDTNQILNGLDSSHLLQLAHTNRTYFGDFRIVHLPGKMLRVTNRETGMTATCWDAFSFIRTSFARWLRDWSIGSEKQLAFIEKMKEGRSTFAAADLPRIRRYNQLELELLQVAVEELLRRIRLSGYKPASWHSPGSIAAAAMKAHGVKDHKGTAPEAVIAAAKEAYFGGRFETRMIGAARGPLFHYDINSAYSAAASRLPCLACGSWKADRRLDLDEPDNLVFVKWTIPMDARGLKDRPAWGPLPVRLPAGSLRYPLVNTKGGWYWSQEAAQARRIVNLKVVRGWRFRRGCEHEPFAFLIDLYQKRQERKAENDPVEYVFKLILNSCYGKLAQRPRGEHGREPAFYQPLWAGNITATTRARLLSVLAGDPRGVIQTATDGLTAFDRMDLPLSNALGDWSEKQLDYLFIVQSGIYFWRDHGGDKVQRSRGFHPSSLTLDACRAHFRRDWRAPLTLTARRFIGYRTALHRRNFEVWRTWADYSVHLGTTPEPRRDLLRRVNGHVESVPILRASADFFDELAGPSFREIQDWETEQPDGPEGDSL